MKRDIYVYGYENDGQWHFYGKTKRNFPWRGAAAFAVADMADALNQVILFAPRRFPLQGRFWIESTAGNYWLKIDGYHLTRMISRSAEAYGYRAFSQEYYYGWEIWALRNLVIRPLFFSLLYKGLVGYSLLEFNFGFVIP